MHLENYLPLLLDLLLKSTVLLALAALLTVAFRRASAANRHAIAVAALVTLLVLPFTKLARPRWAFALNHAAPVAPLTIKLPPILTKASLETGAGFALAVPENAPAKTAGIRVNWSAVVVGVWLAGFALALLYRAGVGWQLRRLAAESHAMKEGRVLALARELAAACGVRAEIRESETCRVPLAFGVWRPTVLLPGEAMGWSNERLSAALQHEFGHIRRRDCLTRWLADLACAFYWMNPLVWLGARSLRLAQEQACDDLVLNSGTRPDDYATQLVDVVRSLQGDRFTARHALAMAQPSTLESRVRAIVDESRDRSARNRRGMFAGFAFATVALALCTAAQLRGADEKRAATAANVQGPARKQVLVEAKFVEITGDNPALWKILKVYNPTVPQAVGILTKDEAGDLLRALNQAKGVDLLSAPRITTLTNQPALIEIVRDLKYPTEWDKNPKTGMLEPTVYDARDVGVKFGVTTGTNADGGITLKMEPEVVEFEGFEDLDAGTKAKIGKADDKLPAGERLIALPDLNQIPKGHRTKPVFNVRKMEASVTLRPEQTAILGGMIKEDVQTVEDTNSKTGRTETSKVRLTRRLFVFVTARILKPDEIPGEKPGEVLGNPAGKTGAVTEPKPLQIVSDEMTFDKKTGTLSASGNVKIETAQATITAATAEITPKKSVPAEAVQSGPQGGSDAMFLREWKVPPGLFPARAAGVSGKSAAQDFLEKNGIVFGQGAVADIEPKRGNLVVRNTQAQLDLIDAYIADRVKSEKAPAIVHAHAYGHAKPEEAWIFPKIDFRDASVRECVDFLVAKSKTLDPKGVGANIVLRNADKFDDARITLSLSDVPFAEVLRYVAALGNCDLVREEFAFVMQPAGTAKAAAPNVLEEKNAAKPPGNAAPQKEAGAAIRKADSIIFPKIDLRDATLSETVEFLRVKSQALDPEKKGVNLVLKLAAGGEEPKITLSLTNVPLSEALRYVASLASYEIVTEDGALIVQESAPFGIPVADKPGFVTSPFSPTKGYIDLRGFPPNTKVKDPYSGRIFRTP